MKVLITGAAGGIGRVLRRELAGRYALLRLTDIAPLETAKSGEECLVADIGDMTAMRRACQGVDCVVHLAGIPVEPEQKAWEQILPTNIAGTYTVFEAARLECVKRMVFASSNHVVGFHRRETVVGADAELRPDTLYGVSKVFGEALGRLYADKHGMTVACLRIGSFRERPEDRRQLATWISHRDMAQLVIRCIEAPDYHFLIAYGISDNSGAFWSNDGLDWLGFKPEDKGDTFKSDLAAAPAEDPVAVQFQGGSFCAMNFTGDSGRIP